MIMFSDRVFLPNIPRGKSSRIRVCNHTMLAFTGLVYTMQLYLLVIDDLLIIRNEIEKRNDIYWDLPYPLRHFSFGKCTL